MPAHGHVAGMLARVPSAFTEHHLRSKSRVVHGPNVKMSVTRPHDSKTHDLVAGRQSGKCKTEQITSSSLLLHLRGSFAQVPPHTGFFSSPAPASSSLLSDLASKVASSRKLSWFPGWPLGRLLTTPCFSFAAVVAVWLHVFL